MEWGLPVFPETKGITYRNLGNVPKFVVIKKDALKFFQELYMPPASKDSDPATPKKVVDAMYNNDPFSQWLGIERLEDGHGRSKLRMTVRPEMLNGFGILHGGVAFSLGDSALAFAANSHGIKCVSIEVSMSYLEAVKEGDVITAIAEEIGLTKKTGIYHITITNQDGVKVSLFKGTVYRTGKNWFGE